jgi:hypothetical protein
VTDGHGSRRCHGERPSGSTLVRVVPRACDQSPVPGQERRRGSPRTPRSSGGGGSAGTGPRARAGRLAGW